MAPTPPLSSPVSRLPSSGLFTVVLVFHLLALALALGPPIFFGAAVAPSVFRILPTRDMAGALQSPILTRACWFAEGSFALLFVTSWFLGRWSGGPRLQRSLLTRAPVLGMIAAVVIEKLLIPSIDAIRAQAPGLIDNLPAADPSRVLLARYHRLSTSFFAAEIAVALVILVVTARLLGERRSAPPAAVPAARPPVPKLLDLSDV
ncbi:MAG: hypothetical protein M3R34_07235 [Acidobacteriota bacterium]|nr:hypothetical protein [Acidobacteriota bacterium]